MLIDDRQEEAEREFATVPVQRPLRIWRWLLTAVIWMAVGAVGGVALATLAPSVAGYKVLTVFTGSMVPTLGVGSVVVDEEIRPSEMRVGDVVTFPDPSNNRRLLTHRVERVRIGQARVYAVTQGDANDTPERWNVSAGERIGRVVYTLPKVGYARQWLAGTGARIGLMVALAIFGLLVLWEVWRPAKQPPGDQDDTLAAPHDR